MIRVAICEINRQEGLRLRSVIDAFAANSDMQNIEVAVVDSYKDLAALIDRLRQDYFDMAICRVETDGTPDARKRVAQAISNIANRTRTTKFALASSDPAVAMCAYDIGATFMRVPLEQEEFIRVVIDYLERVTAKRRRAFSVKSAKSVVNMNLNDITFVETNKKGPIIHLPGSNTVAVRGTLQALFDRLNNLDGRFVRAGGSFIINLDNIRSTGERSVIFGDGEAIILPVRARKAIQDAFTAYRMRVS